MAAGLAIITTDDSACAQVVGQNALLVKPRNHQEVRHALEKLINDTGLCEILGRASRKRVEEKFNWPAIAKMYENKYLKYGYK